MCRNLFSGYVFCVVSVILFINSVLCGFFYFLMQAYNINYMFHHYNYLERMFDFNQILALKELVAGEQEEEIVENYQKGSMLNPGTIGGGGQKKQIAKPNAKVQPKIGQKYVPRIKKTQEEAIKQKTIMTTTKDIDPKHQIWTDEEIKELPMNLDDPRPQPDFETLYRQKVGTQDVYLGLSGVDPSSNHCNQIVYKIKLPDTVLNQIQIDITQQAMVLQTSKFYLSQYFQYKVDSKKAKAQFISDKETLKLILPVIRDNDF